MNDPALDTYQPGFFSELVYFAYDLSAAWIAIVVLVSIAVGLWLAYKALPFFRVIQALKTAPQVAVGSGKEGAAARDLVKVVGRAYPGSVRGAGPLRPEREPYPAAISVALLAQSGARHRVRALRALAGARASGLLSGAGGCSLPGHADDRPVDPSTRRESTHQRVRCRGRPTAARWS